MKWTEEVRSNVFPLAQRAIDWETFDWEPHAAHRDSVQAFTLSVWGSLSDAEIRRQVLGELNDELLERLWAAAPGRFTAGNSSELDAWLNAAEGQVGVYSRHIAAPAPCPQFYWRACTGTYGPGSDPSRLSHAWCPFDVDLPHSQAQAYWPKIRSLSRSGSYPLGQPCAFQGPTFSLMRAVTRSAQESGQWRTILAHGPHAQVLPALETWLPKLRPEARRRVLVLDYAKLAERLAASSGSDARQLAAFMRARL